MAYPTIDKAYGLKPVNLVGGQVFSGSTRMYPIAYNYATALYYGDNVSLTSGFVTQLASSNYNAVTTTARTSGVFLGCYYTNPTTKQRLYSQFYPGLVTAGDITAVICDDPDTVFKVAAVTSATSGTIASVSQLAVGGNLAGSTTLTGTAATGNSAGGVVAAAATTASAGYRVLSLVPDTQISYTGLYQSGATTTTLGVSGLTVGQVIPTGTDVYLLVSGQLQHIGSATTAPTTVSTTGTTSLTVVASTVTPTVGATLVLVQSPEVLVKFNFSCHSYYNVA